MKKTLWDLKRANKLKSQLQINGRETIRLFGLRVCELRYIVACMAYELLYGTTPRVTSVQFITNSASHNITFSRLIREGWLTKVRASKYKVTRYAWNTLGGGSYDRL